MKSIIYSGLIRIAGFVPQGLATLLTSNLIIRHYGVDTFSAYALILTVLMLLPLNNLGVGASITQSVAASGVEDDSSVRAGLTAARVLTISTLVAAALATVVGLLDLWPTLLGESSGQNAFVAGAIVIYALSFVPGLGLSVLLGTGRNHLVILVQLLSSLIAVLLVWFLVAMEMDGKWVVLVPAIAILGVNAASLLLSQLIAKFPWTSILPRVPLRSRYPGIRVRSLAGPMLVVSLALPTAFLADRIVLSQVSTSHEVAKYALVLQIFAPVTGLIVATAQPLWPMFTRARAAGQAGPGLRLVLVAFGGGTLVANVVLVLIADWLGKVISDDKISLGYGLPTLAALYTLGQAIAFPLSMSMVDPRGVRLVAACSVISVPTNITLAVLLAEQWGAAGPLTSSVIVGFGIQVLPWTIFSMRRSGQQVEV